MAVESREEGTPLRRSVARFEDPTSSVGLWSIRCAHTIGGESGCEISACCQFGFSPGGNYPSTRRSSCPRRRNLGCQRTHLRTRKRCCRRGDMDHSVIRIGGAAQESVGQGRYRDQFKPIYRHRYIFSPVIRSSSRHKYRIYCLCDSQRECPRSGIGYLPEVVTGYLSVDFVPRKVSTTIRGILSV